MDFFPVRNINLCKSNIWASCNILLVPSLSSELKFLIYLHVTFVWGSLYPLLNIILSPFPMPTTYFPYCHDFSQLYGFLITHPFYPSLLTSTGTILIAAIHSVKFNKVDPMQVKITNNPLLRHDGDQDVEIAWHFFWILEKINCPPLILKVKNVKIMHFQRVYKHKEGQARRVLIIHYSTFYNLLRRF